MPGFLVPKFLCFLELVSATPSSLAEFPVTDGPVARHLQQTGWAELLVRRAGQTRRIPGAAGEERNVESTEVEAGDETDREDTHG